jgi:hypothetical protein
LKTSTKINKYLKASEKIKDFIKEMLKTNLKLVISSKYKKLTAKNN